LKQSNPKLRETAVSELSRMRPKAKATTAAVLLALQDEDRNVRAQACKALGVLKAEAEVVVPPMIRTLADPDYWARCNAAETLGLYQADAKAAFPLLLELRNATNRDERHCVRQALKLIDPEAAHKAGIE
jgi:HEAT repeat protein